MKNIVFLFFLGLLFSSSLHTTQHDPTPYLLPNSHPLKPILDSIFSKQDVLKNEQTFSQAGFKTIMVKRTSGIRLAKHPRIPGHLFKLYLDSDLAYRYKDVMSKQDCLIQRCIGAQRIRDLITTFHLQHFTVPNKWLYSVFSTLEKGDKNEKVFILLVTDMNILNTKQSKKAWKKNITKKHLEELFIIMKNGCGSGGLALNVPYTRSGTFAFIDTEYLNRTFDLPQEKKFFSKEMACYWDILTKSH